MQYCQSLSWSANMENESWWRPVKGFESNYEISREGTVRSVTRLVTCTGKISGQVHCQRSKVLSPVNYSSNSFGYFLYRNGRREFKSVRKLLKETFPETEFNFKNLVYRKADDNVISAENEIWKPIEGFEGYYEVSNTGKVRSVERTIQLEGRRSGQVRTYSSRELKPLLVAGHTIVKLYKDRTYQSVGVGRLVALHFLEGFKESGRSKIRYKDGDITNCSVDNLE